MWSVSLIFCRQILPTTIPPQRIPFGHCLPIHSRRGEVLETGDYNQTGPQMPWPICDHLLIYPIGITWYPGTAQRPQRERSRAKRCLHDVQVRIAVYPSRGLGS